MMDQHATGNPRDSVPGGVLEGTIEPGTGVRSFKGIPFERRVFEENGV